MTGKRLSSSQRGRIAEHYAATALMVATGGRLSPFFPLVDDHGIDLIVFDKATGRSLAVQVKSWLAAGGPERRGTVQFDIRKATFAESADAVVIAVVLDPNRMALEASWLIPMADVPALSVVHADKYALTPSRVLQSRDRYARYRYSDAGSLGEAVLAMIENG